MSKYEGLSLAELKRLRCAVMRDDVPVPGCICVPLGDDGRGKYGSGTSFGRDWGFGGSKGPRGSRGSRGSGRLWDFSFLYGWNDSLDGAEEGTTGTSVFSEPGEGGGAGLKDYDFIRFFLEPCDHIMSTPSVSSEISCVELELQRTIVIVKPDALVFKDVILRAIFEAGFQIVGKRILHLTPEQVSEIYVKYYGSPTFPHLVVSVSAKPVLVIAISALNVISKWNKMIGIDGSLRAEWFFPISMSKRFGLQKTMGYLLHGSENLMESNRENRYFYENSILEPILSEVGQVTDYCNLKINPTLLNGLTEVAKKKPNDPILYLAEWLLTNNPFQPRFPNHIALLPT